MLPAEPRLGLRDAVALGLLHGPAELLPISSSGHTTLIPWLAGWPYAELDGSVRKSFEVALHAGTGLALAIDMRGELGGALGALDRRRASVLALSLLPAAAAGLSLRAMIERRLGGPRSIALGLATGAVAMALADVGASRAGSARACSEARAADGLALGLAQAGALMPGVSRNGATLTAARARGFAPAAAQQLSWDVALPVILGAGALECVRLMRGGLAPDARAPFAGGAAAAFLSTLALARTLRRRERRSLLPYALYRCLLAAIVLARLRREQEST